MSDEYTPKAEVTSLAKVGLTVEEDTGRKAPPVGEISEFREWLRNSDILTLRGGSVWGPSHVRFYVRHSDVDRVTEQLQAHDIPVQAWHTGDSDELGVSIDEGRDDG